VSVIVTKSEAQPPRAQDTILIHTHTHTHTHTSLLTLHVLHWEASVSVSQLCITETKYLGYSAYEEERFILTRGFSPWPLDPTAFGPVVRQAAHCGTW
jgi:hypothetical protein